MEEQTTSKEVAVETPCLKTTEAEKYNPDHFLDDVLFQADDLETVNIYLPGDLKPEFDGEPNAFIKISSSNEEVSLLFAANDEIDLDTLIKIVSKMKKLKTFYQRQKNKTVNFVDKINN